MNDLFTGLVVSSAEQALLKANSRLENQKIKTITKRERLDDCSNISELALEISELAERLGLDKNDIRISADKESDFMDAPAILFAFYNVEVPKTGKELRDDLSRYFRDAMYPLLYKQATENGFIRVGYSTSKLAEFDDQTPYDMYVGGNIDRLVKYYSLSFKPS